MLNSIPSTLLGKPIKPNKVYFKQNRKALDLAAEIIAENFATKIDRDIVNSIIEDAKKNTEEPVPPTPSCDKGTPDYEERLRNMSKHLPQVEGYDNNTLLFGETLSKSPAQQEAENLADKFATKTNSDIIDDMIEAANKRGEDSHSICYSAKRIGKEERERRRVRMPLGMWDSQGYWRPNIRISMTAEEQYETNKAMGIEMKMRRMSQAEVVEEMHKRIDPVQDTIDATNKGLTEAFGSHKRKKREEASYRSMKHEEYLVMRENLKNKYVDIVMAMPDEWVLPPRATELFNEVLKVMDNSYGPKR